MALPTAARVCLAAGTLGLVLSVVNQVSAPSLDPPLERAAVLASLLAVVLMLVGVLWTRWQPVPPERAELHGDEGLDLADGLPEELRRELAWGSRLLLTATPAAVVWAQWDGRTMLRRGLLAPTPFEPGVICRRSLEKRQQISLVDMRLYPGRGEFEGLLGGLPAVVVQPVGERGLLVLGGWSPRCFGRSDLLWIEGWAQKLSAVLMATASAPIPSEPEPGSSPVHPGS